MGQVLQAGAGQNPARQSAIGAGIGWNVPAVTINKVCLSGLTAVIDAARMIRSGDASVVVAGGQESMTRAPAPAARLPPGLDLRLRPGARRRRPRRPHRRLRRRVHGPVHGEQERHAGHRPRPPRTRWPPPRTSAPPPPPRTGSSTAKSSPISVQQRKGDPLVVDTDEGVRPGHVRRHPRRACARRSPRTAPSPPATPRRSPTAPPPWSLTSRKFAEENGLECLAVVGRPGQVAGPGQLPAFAALQCDQERPGEGRLEHRGPGLHRDQRGLRLGGRAVPQGPGLPAGAVQHPRRGHRPGPPDRRLRRPAGPARAPTS